MKKICKVCQREFECYDKPYTGRHGILKQRAGAVTCSSICSKTWARTRGNKSHVISMEN